MTNKLGFVVGHPTQFEGPMYQCFNKLDKTFLKVYFYDGSKTSRVDKELDNLKKQTWGIDILSGYLFEELKAFDSIVLNTIIKENKYIIVNGYVNRFTLLLLLLAKVKSKPIGLRLDTVIWNNKNVFKKFVKRILIKTLDIFTDTFWVIGTKTKEYLLFNGINPNKIKYLSYVVDNEWFKVESDLTIEKKNELKKSLNISEKLKVVLCVSKLVDRELPIDVIDAIEILKGKNICLLIAGDGNKREFLEKYVESKNLTKKVHFMGYVDYSKLPSIYAICDLFIHPSKNEPWGVSVQEALACGKPVISSNFVGAGYDLLVEGENGFIYNYNDVVDLANKIEASLMIAPEQIKSINNSILNKWNYKSTFKLINEHIHNL